MSAHNGSAINSSKRLISEGTRAWRAAIDDRGLQDPAVLATARSMVEKGTVEEPSAALKDLR